MNVNTRPWLRFLEGTEGAQAGGDNSQQTNDTAAQGSADVGKSVGDDQGKGDRVSGDDAINPAAQRLLDAVKSQVKASEPASKEEKADAPKIEDLLKRLDDQQKVIDALKESDIKANQEKRDKLAVEVAKAAKLPESMAARLTGDTKEQLEADAKELAKAFGSLVVDPAQGQGSGKAQAPSMEQAIAAKLAAAGLK